MTDRSRPPRGPEGNGSMRPERAIGDPLDRRGFIKTSSGLFVLGAIGFGCTASTETSSGTITVRVLGLASGLPSGGTVQVSGTSLNQPRDFPLPGTGIRSESVPAGSYTLTYTPPTGYGMEPGETNVTTISVTEKETAEHVFNVEQVTGRLRVNVGGLGPNPVSGGSLLAQRVGAALATALTFPLPASGADLLSLVPDSYDLVYTPPSGHSLAPGAVATATVVVSPTVEATFNVNVQVIPAPSGVLFHSNWSSALGTSDLAVMDQGKTLPWNIRGGGCEVVAATGLNMPTPNCLRVGWGNGLFNFLRRSGLSVPPVGTSRYYRWYFRLDIPDGVADAETHPMQDGYTAADANWMFKVWHNLAGPGRWLAQFEFLGNAYPNQRWRATQIRLNKRDTYRIEVRIQRTAVNGYRANVRIFDSTNTLVVSDANFFQEDSTTVTLASNPTFAFRNVNELAGFNAGANDAGPEAGIYGYQAAVAISDVDWLGPYAAGI